MSKEGYVYKNYDYDYKIINNSNLFDYIWYIDRYGDGDVEDPIKHFLDVGCANNFNPSPNFDMVWYLSEYGDVKDSGLNPFVHYIVYGQFEGRFTQPFLFDLKYKDDYYTILRSGLFDVGWFCSYYSLDEDVDPIIFYLEHCVEYGLNPSRDFDSLWYLDEYGDVKDSGLNPFVYYIELGQNENKLAKTYHMNEIGSLNLKKTIRGRNGYLFLINDTNNDLMQHFDKNYVNKFPYDDFVDAYFFKKYFFEKMNIKALSNILWVAIY